MGVTPDYLLGEELFHKHKDEDLSDFTVLDSRYLKLDASNDPITGQLELNIATGTSPFLITSTTVNTNLNADLLDGLHDTAFLKVANNLSDLNNVATARTNLGLVAGGTGDIWVEKAGDTMTGDLLIKPSTDSITGFVVQDKDANNVLTIDTVNNRVGIGTTSPNQVFDTKGWGRFQGSGSTNNGDSGAIEFYNNNASSVNIQAQIRGLRGIADFKAGQLGFYTAAASTGTLSQQMTINSSGYVGVGITAPTARLHIVGSDDVNQLLVKSNATQTTLPIALQTGTGIVAGLNSSGWLGLGVTSPAFQLDMRKNTSTNDKQVYMSNSITYGTGSYSQYYSRQFYDSVYVDASVNADYYNNFFYSVYSGNGASSPNVRIWAQVNQVDTGYATAYAPNAIEGLWNKITHYSTAKLNGAAGMRCEANNQNTGGIGSAVGAYFRIINTCGLGTGVIDNAYSLYVQSPVLGNGGTITNNRGLYIENQNIATATNYAIYTNNGLNRFGDQLFIDGSSDIIQLRVQGHSTQTTNLLEFQNSGGTGLSAFGPNGNLRIGSTTVRDAGLEVTKTFTSPDLSPLLAYYYGAYSSVTTQPSADTVTGWKSVGLSLINTARGTKNFGTSSVVSGAEFLVQDARTTGTAPNMYSGVFGFNTLPASGAITITTGRVGTFGFNHSGAGTATITTAETIYVARPTVSAGLLQGTSSIGIHIDNFALNRENNLWTNQYAILVDGGRTLLQAGCDIIPFAVNGRTTVSKDISTISVTSNVVTITTTAAHTFVKGEYITIAGATTLTTLNGVRQITSIVSTTAFTVALTTGDLGTTAETGTTVVSQSRSLAEFRDSSGNVAFSVGLTEVVANEAGTATTDFRVESDTEVNMVFVDSNADTDGAVYLGGSTNGIKINKGGNLTLLGTATVFDDLMPNAVSVGTGGGVPAFTAYNGNLKAYEFVGAALTKEIHAEFQLPHAYKEGSNIEPHIHLYVPNDATGGVIKFGCEYTWVNIDGTEGATATITGTVTIAAGAGNLHKMISFGSITGTGKTISSILSCRIYRDPADAADTFGASVWMKAADVHHERDKIGSFT